MFGTDLSAVTVDALLDFSASRGERPIGFHVFGQAALMLLTSIRTKLIPPEAPSLPGNWTTPVRIVSPKDVNFLIERRETYSQAINTLYEGEPIIGKTAICERMTKVLGESKRFLDVTHIASSGSTIDLVADLAFQEWLGRNYAAARGDGRERIRVRRIFMISREHKGNAALEQMMREIANGGVEVYYLFLDEISPAFHEDFSLYDDRDVIFVRYQGRGGWIPESEARHSRNPATIAAFRRIFDLAVERAKRLTADQPFVAAHLPNAPSAPMHPAGSKPS